MDKSDDKPLFSCEADFQRLLKKRFLIPETSFSQAVNEIRNNSFVFRSFRNEFETDHLFTKHSLDLLKSGGLKLDELDDEEISSNENHIPGYKPLSFLPSYSELSRKEMTQCYYMYAKLCHNKPLSRHHLALHKKYFEVITREQTLFQEIAEDAWYKTNFSRHGEIKNEVLEYTTEMWKKRLQRLTWYPKHYMKYSDLRLIDDSDKKSELIFIKNLHNLGQPSIFYSKTFGLKPYFIDKNMEKLCNDRSSSRDVQLFSYKTAPEEFMDKGYHPEVSRDNIAQKLAAENNAQIVMSASSFLELLDNHEEIGQEGWCIPIVIEELAKDPQSVGPPRKIVYLDKALPPKSLTAYQRNKWFYKKKIPFLLRNPLIYVQKKRDSKPNYTDLDNPYNSISEMFNDNTIGQDGRFQTDYSDGFKFHSQGNINTLLTSDVLSQGYSKNEKIFMNKEEDLNDSNCDIPAEENEKDEQLNQNKVEDYMVTYNFWSLKCDTSNPLLKSNLKDINLIIRCKIGGKPPGVQKAQITASKLEFQLEFGAEVTTKSEICRDWGNILIRPKSELIRVRIDPVNGEIIMVEQKKISDLTAEYLRLYSKNPYDKLGSVHVILNELVDLPAGNYLLHYNPTDGLFSKIYKEEKRKHTFNLNLDYIHVDCTNVSMAKGAWLKIDTMVLTPTCQHFSRIPATFYPKISKLSSKLEGSKCQGLVQKAFQLEDKLRDSKRLKRKICNRKKKQKMAAKQAKIEENEELQDCSQKYENL